MDKKKLVALAVLLTAVVVCAIAFVLTQEDAKEDLRTDIVVGDFIETSTMSDSTWDITEDQDTYEGLIDFLYPDLEGFEKTGEAIVECNGIPYETDVFAYFIEDESVTVYYVVKGSGFLLKSLSFDMLEIVVESSFDPSAPKSVVTFQTGDHIRFEYFAEETDSYDGYHMTGWQSMDIGGYDEDTMMYTTLWQSEMTSFYDNEYVIESVEGNMTITSGYVLSKNSVLSHVSYEHFLMYLEECDCEYDLGEKNQKRIDTAYGSRAVTEQEIIVHDEHESSVYTLYYGESGILYKSICVICDGYWSNTITERLERTSLTGPAVVTG